MYKQYTYQVETGTEALVIALQQLDATRVIIPSLTCMDILRAVKQSQCEYVIVDCDFDLQIDLAQVIKYSNECDTVIVPHMFGIRANVKDIRLHTNLKIIEDLSQCHGLPDLGKFADIVIASTNKSKWLNLNGGGLLFSDNILNLPSYDFSIHQSQIRYNLIRRTELAAELQEAGIQLIGNESSWLRGMYYTKQKSSRMPYIPLHIYDRVIGEFKINQYIDNINWVSIII